MNYQNLVHSIVDIAKLAGSSILDIYDKGEGFADISYKDDNSPLTLADKASNDVIFKALKELTPSIPILSEEGKKISYNDRKSWNQFWLIDPLDGTKEFINRNGEFTVNIALIENGAPILGVVYAPVIDVTWFGTLEQGSFKSKNNDDPKLIKVNIPNEDSTIKIVSSRSHSNNPKLEDYLNNFNQYELVKMGSSIKICLVADGSAHLYPRFGPTMEWDTAAAHAVVKFAGGNIINFHTNHELSYNKDNLLNPEFLVNYK